MIESRIPNPGSLPSVHVVAGVLRDGDGRILLTQRVGTRDWAGAWEFPGGKVEASESAHAALQRELREELGIEIGASRPLIAVPQQYADKRIVLDVYEVDRFAGTPAGREGQALAWTAAAALAGVAMPPADLPVVAALLDSPRYLITPVPGEDDERFLALLDAALPGMRRAQLRLPPTLAPDRTRRLVSAAAGLAAAREVELLLNSGSLEAVALARELGLGLHLRAADLAAPPAGVRLVGASCHDEHELRRAEQLGCRFAVLGPVASTPSHPGAATLGWTRFAALRAHVALPVYALGGLTAADHAVARAHGAQGIAAIRAHWPLPPEPTAD